MKYTLKSWGLHVISEEAFIMNSAELSSRIKTLVRICRDNDKRKVLYETTDTTSTTSITDIYWAIGLLLKVEAIGFDVAIVIPPEIEIDRSRKFVETTAHNQAINIKYFKHPDEARKWLKVD